MKSGLVALMLTGAAVLHTTRGTDTIDQLMRQQLETRAPSERKALYDRVQAIVAS